MGNMRFFGFIEHPPWPETHFKPLSSSRRGKLMVCAWAGSQPFNCEYSMKTHINLCTHPLTHTHTHTHTHTQHANTRTNTQTHRVTHPSFKGVRLIQVYSSMIDNVPECILYCSTTTSMITIWHCEKYHIHIKRKAT